MSGRCSETLISAPAELTTVGRLRRQEMEVYRPIIRPFISCQVPPTFNQDRISIPDNSHREEARPQEEARDQEEARPHSSVDMFPISNHRKRHQAVLVYLPARQITGHLRHHHQTGRVRPISILRRSNVRLLGAPRGQQSIF